MRRAWLILSMIAVLGPAAPALAQEPMASYTVEFQALEGGTLSGGTSEMKVKVSAGGTISASAVGKRDPDHHFTAWKILAGEKAAEFSALTDASLTLRNVSGDIAVAAEFAIDVHRVLYIAGAGGTLQEGKTELLQEVEDRSAAAEVIAGAGAGYRFLEWRVVTGEEAADFEDLNREALQISDIQGPVQVEAVFEPDEYRLTIDIDEPFTDADARVQRIPDRAVYTYGDIVTLQPVPGTGEDFHLWAGPHAGDVIPADTSGTFTLTIDGDKTLEAVFKKKVVVLTMEKVGQGTGATVPAAEIPGPHHLYEWGDAVEVAALPSEETSIFVGWSGNVITGEQDASRGIVIMEGDRLVTASFDLKTFTVTYLADDNGSLLDIRNESHDRIVQEVKYGFGVPQVVAVPDPDFMFDRWSGDLAWGRPELQIGGVERNMTVQAHFRRARYTLTFSSGESGEILVGDRLYDREYTETVEHGGVSSEVTAVPEDNFQFKGWTGDFTSSDLTIQIPYVVDDMLITYQEVPDIVGCSTDVVAGYTGGFDPEQFEMTNVALVEDSGRMQLQTGNRAIVPEKVVIPFTQDVTVTFLYEGAGYVSDFGWMFHADAVDENGNFRGWNNIPLNRKHAIFHNIRDDAETGGCCGGGNGVFDSDYGRGRFPTGSESSLAAYDDGTGQLFHVDNDGQISPRDMKKKIGRFAGGTEIVFFLTADRDWDTTDESRVFFNTAWNPDTYRGCLPEEESGLWIDRDLGLFQKLYHLGAPIVEGGCKVENNWLAKPVFQRMQDHFGVALAGDYRLKIIDGEPYAHVIVGAPPDDPNQWILGFEDLNADANASDMDHNDMVFLVERKTGGAVRLQSKNAIVPNEDGSYFSGAQLEVFDFYPGGNCRDKTEITYYLSVDDGERWVEVTAWDRVRSVIFHEDGSWTLGDDIDPPAWTPGIPESTYRSRRIDFAGKGLTGRKLLWKVELISSDEECMPEVANVLLTADTASHGFFTRSSPVVQTNVLYAGSYETPLPTWAERVNRGRMTASLLYDPADPEESLSGDQTLWDAGEVLAQMSPDDRIIHVPDISVHPVEQEHLRGPDGIFLYGDGATRTFSGSFEHRPVQATSVRIYDSRPEVLSDELSDELAGSLGGRGSIDRFTGQWKVTFNAAPAAGVPIMANYAWYEARTTLAAFEPGRVTNEMLALTDEIVLPRGYVYDFDGDGVFDSSDEMKDAAWLVQWIRGYRQPRSLEKKEWLLGPIDHSVPALMTPPGYPAWYFGSQVSDKERDIYEGFRKAHGERDTVLFVGSRDGMLHAFDAGKFRHGDNPDTTAVKENRGYFLWEPKTADSLSYCDGYTGKCPNYGTGRELWAFIPADLLPKLKNNLLRGDRQAYVDASPALADVYVDTGDDGRNDTATTVLLSAEGNGGNTVFCLDVTAPGNPGFMWEFSAPELFRSRSSPAVAQVGRIRDPSTNRPRWVAFFVTGKVENVNRFPAVYMIDIFTGSVLKRVVLDAGVDLNGDGRVDADESGYGRGGVPSGQPAVVDSDENGFVDRLYVASDRGFMYKINLPDDPENPSTEISHCVLNTDFSDETGNSIPPEQRWHPVYASPAVVVDNRLSPDGTIDYRVLVFFGTGDSPYYDEDINAAETTYHFFAYADAAGKGECNPDAHRLDWYIALDPGHRIFSSAFAAAGQLYFGTTTSETEDPCEGHLTPGGNKGTIHVVDLLGTVITHHTVGDIASPPLVEDEHLYLRVPTGLLSLGSGRYNNPIRMSGRPRVRVRAWRELD